jgi:hypothetical protein
MPAHSNNAIIGEMSGLASPGPWGDSVTVLIVRNENIVTYEDDDIAYFNVEDTAERSQAWMGREPGVVQIPLSWNTCFLGDSE